MFEEEVKSCRFRAKASEKLNDFRIFNKYCDVNINVQDETFHCHRAVLASACEYFDAMFSGSFKESFTENVTLYDIDVTSFRILLEFMYTGCVADTLLNDIGIVEHINLLRASSILNISAVEEYCVSFIINCEIKYQFEEVNELLFLASSINNEKMMFWIIGGILRNFSQWFCHQINLEIPFCDINLIFKSYKTFEKYSNYLNVIKFRDEDIALDTIIQWVHHKLDDRKKHFEKLSEWIRFGNVSAEYVQFLSKEYGVAVEDKLALRRNIVDYFELKSNANLKNGVVVQRPISFRDPSLARNQLHLYICLTYSHEPSVIQRYRTDEDTTIWYCSQNTIVISDDTDPDLGNVAFGNNRLYSLVDHKFLFSTTTNWSLDSRLLQYPPCTLNSFDMCGVESDNSIYLYNSDIFTEPLTIDTNASSLPAFSKEEIRRGIFSYNCELDRWCPVPEMKEKLAESCIIADENLLYMIGGNELNGRIPEGYVQAYDNRMKNWLQLSRTNNYYDDHRACCASIFNGKLYVSNGFEIEAFDTVAGKWEKLQSTSPCSDHLVLYERVSRMVSYKNSLWLLSSDSQPKDATDEFERPLICTNIINPFDENSEKWQKCMFLNDEVGRIAVNKVGQDIDAFSVKIKNFFVFE